MFNCLAFRTLLHTVICALFFTISLYTYTQNLHAQKERQADTALLWVKNSNIEAVQINEELQKELEQEKLSFSLMKSQELKGRLMELAFIQNPMREQYLNKRLKVADNFFDGLETRRAIRVYQEIIVSLENEAEISDKEYNILEESRIRCSVALLSVAPSQETGLAQSHEGKTALNLLHEALKNNQSLVLDAVKYPPKTRKVLELARTRLKNQTGYPLEIQTKTKGLNIFLEGQYVGTTPLKQLKSKYNGRYRLSFESQGHRSKAVFIEINNPKENIFTFDLTLELMIDAENNAIWPLSPQKMDQKLLEILCKQLNIDQLLLSGYYVTSDKNKQKRLFIARYRTGRAMSITSFSAREISPTKIKSVVSWIKNNTFNDATPLPNSVFEETLLKTQNSEFEETSNIFLYTGIAAGTVLAVTLLAGGIVGIVYMIQNNMDDRNDQPIGDLNKQKFSVEVN